jgi:hypothetical protein
MSKRRAHLRIWLAILRVTGFGFLFIWLGYVILFVRFDATRPIKSDAESGRVIPQQKGRHIVYLNEQEQNQLLDLQHASVGLFLIATVAAYLYKKESSKH